MFVRTTLPLHRKFLTVGLLVVGLLLLTPQTPSAQTTYNGSFRTPGENNFLAEHDPELAEVLTGCKNDRVTGSFAVVLQTVNKLVAGFETQEPFCLTDKDVNIDPEYKENITRQNLPEEANNGILPRTLNLSVNILDQRPASGVVFAMDQVQRAVEGPMPVYAQESDSDGPTPYFPGQGFDLLRPIQSFWAWAVTLSYSVMILVVIVVAFAMMFRSRLGGKEVVQIQNAIPGIVLAMILIPLSYPISGLFIDAITLSTNIVHDLLLSDTGIANEVYENAEVDGQGFNEGDGLYAHDPRLGIFRVAGIIRISSLGELLQTTDEDGDTSATIDCINIDQIDTQRACRVGTAIPNLLINIITVIYNLFAEEDADTDVDMIMIIIQFLFEMTALVIAVRILKRLLIKFLVLMLLPVISPFLFVGVAIPGRGMSTLNWFASRMGSAALYYIVTYSVFLLVIIFTSPEFYTIIPNPETYTYSPPLISPIFADLFGAASAGASGGVIRLLFTMVGVGLFVSIPRMLDSINKMLGVDDGIPQSLKTPFQDLGSAADIALRQVPGRGLSVAGSIASAGQANYRSYINRRTDPFGKTAGEQELANLKEKSADRRARISSGSGVYAALPQFARNALNSGLDSVDNVRAGFYTDKENPISGTGDKLSLNELEINLNGQIVTGSFNINPADYPQFGGGLGTRAGSKPSDDIVDRISGTLTVKKGDESKAMTGFIYFKKQDSSGITSPSGTYFAVANFEGGSTLFMDSKGFESVGNGEYMKYKSIQNESKQSFPVVLVVSKNVEVGRSYPMKDKKNVSMTFSEDGKAQSATKSASFTLTVSRR